jgi:hypothetical protein
MRLLTGSRQREIAESDRRHSAEHAGLIAQISKVVRRHRRPACLPRRRGASVARLDMRKRSRAQHPTVQKTVPAGASNCGANVERAVRSDGKRSAAVTRCSDVNTS